MVVLRTGMLIIMCISLFSGLCLATELPEDIVFVTEEYPPFSYLENGVPAGLSVELLETALKRANIEFSSDQIRLMAWPDAYRTALTTNGTGLFSTARTPERENLFRWAGPLMQCPVVLFSENPNLKTDRPANQDLKVVAIRDDIGEQVALDAGISKENIFLVTTPSEAVQRVIDGTSDAWAYGHYPGESLIQTIAEDPDSFYILDELTRSTYYIAFNQNTEPGFIEIIQNELDAMKQDQEQGGISTYEKIVGKYIGPVCAEKTHSRQQITDLVNLTADAISRDATGTLADIQAGKHPYLDRNDPSLYVFIYDTSVTLITQAGRPDLAGVHFAGKPDVSGKNFRDDIVTGAMKEGTGFVTYTYSNPLETGIFFKEAYYTLVTGSDKKQYVVCAGRYVPCDET